MSLQRLPGCAGQAADAVSACTQVNTEDAPSLFKKFRSQNAQMFGYVHRGIGGQNLGPTSKVQRFFLSEICMDNHLLASCGKGQFDKVLFGTRIGESTELAMPTCASKARSILDCTRG